MKKLPIILDEETIRGIARREIVNIHIPNKIEKAYPIIDKINSVEITGKGVRTIIPKPCKRGDTMYIQEPWFHPDCFAKSGGYFWKYFIPKDKLNNFKDYLGNPIQWNEAETMPEVAARLQIYILDCNLHQTEEESYWDIFFILK